MALPLPVIPPQPDAYHLAPHRIKRCTFRRLINVEMGAQRVYDVECLFPDRKVPIPLGDLEAATPGQDINWLEDVELLEEEGTPAVFDRYSNSFIRIYFKIPKGRENEIARKVLVKHLQSGNSYGIQLKEAHTKFPQPELGPWVEDSKTVGTDYTAPVLEGWEKPAGH